MFQVFCPNVEGWETFLLTLVLLDLAECSSPVLRCEKLDFPTGGTFTSRVRKIKGKIPFVIIYSATVLRGGRSGPQGPGEQDLRST